MTSPQPSGDPLVRLPRDQEVAAFKNEVAHANHDCRGGGLRGSDLRGLDAAGIDFRDAYLRDADLRGID
jgi:uncharacterized protein YjbI with pentapeptide repeats